MAIMAFPKRRTAYPIPGSPAHSLQLAADREGIAVLELLNQEEVDAARPSAVFLPVAARSIVRASSRQNEKPMTPAAWV